MASGLSSRTAFTIFSGICYVIAFNPHRAPTHSGTAGSGSRLTAGTTEATGCLRNCKSMQPAGGRGRNRRRPTQGGRSQTLGVWLPGGGGAWPGGPSLLPRPSVPQILALVSVQRAPRSTRRRVDLQQTRLQSWVFRSLHFPDN